MKEILAEEEIVRAVDIQRRGYQLLQWMEKALNTGFISPEAAGRYGSSEEAAIAWLDEHFLNIPPDARPQNRADLTSFSAFFSTYLESTFELDSDPGPTYSTRVNSKVNGSSIGPSWSVFGVTNRLSSSNLYSKVLKSPGLIFGLLLTIGCIVMVFPSTSYVETLAARDCHAIASWSIFGFSGNSGLGSLPLTPTKLMYFLVNIQIEGCGFVIISASGPVIVTSETFQTPTNPFIAGLG